jgi:hypothetical protein
MVIAKRRIARFSVVALSTFVAGAGAWALKQELDEIAELVELTEQAQQELAQQELAQQNEATGAEPCNSRRP